MRWVECHGKVYLASRCRDIRAEPLVVFHVTVIVKGCFAIEFIEQVLWVFAKRVDEKIQSATVGHADNNLFRPM